MGMTGWNMVRDSRHLISICCGNIEILAAYTLKLQQLKNVRFADAVTEWNRQTVSVQGSMLRGTHVCR